MASVEGKNISGMSLPWIQRVRRWVPNRLLAAWRRRYGWQWYRGEYASWSEAMAASRGYQDGEILKRVLAATRDVKAGVAAWERDGVAFQRPEANEPLLAVLRQVAQQNQGRLVVVDFGGSLGSTWWQHRLAFADIPSVAWRVVEQPHFVAAGQEFSDAHLSFHLKLNDALSSGAVDVILLSSVLPYLESPLALLKEISSSGVPHVVIDRTPLVRTGPGRLTVQHTPPALGGGSYPSWLFAPAALQAALGLRYRVCSEWPAIDELAPDVCHRGIHFRRKES
jgi:putative methyltransferase (TIGR04325 family)